jgi:predicted homoserine dehydrogenase-like protein
VQADRLDVMVEATGDPIAGVHHALLCCDAGINIVMVNVEADVLCGAALAYQARRAGLVYSLAYGDQPALIAEQVDWARAVGLEVVSAGKGTKYLPSYHASTPNTVWEHYGITPSRAAEAGMNPQMFNSFLDGTKSSIEMAAVANATGLKPPRDGLAFPPCGIAELPAKMKPRVDGGVLTETGMVEVVSSLNRDGSVIDDDLRWGVYVTFRAPSAYVAGCFSEYGMNTDSSGQYAALYRPYHLIGLELGISVASVALRGEATGSPAAFNGDVVAVAKRDLKSGETLDGEGGYTVWGQLYRAADSVAMGGLPIGLAKDAILVRDRAAGEPVTWSDVRLDTASEAARTRREMEQMFGPDSVQIA